MRRERGVAREADAGILTDFEDNDRRAAVRSSISGHTLSKVWQKLRTAAARSLSARSERLSASASPTSPRPRRLVSTPPRRLRKCVAGVVRLGRRTQQYLESRAVEPKTSRFSTPSCSSSRQAFALEGAISGLLHGLARGSRRPSEYPIARACYRPPWRGWTRAPCDRAILPEPPRHAAPLTHRTAPPRTSKRARLSPSCGLTQAPPRVPLLRTRAPGDARGGRPWVRPQALRARGRTRRARRDRPARRAHRCRRAPPRGRRA